MYATLDAARMTGMLAGPVIGGVAVGSVGFAATMALDAMSSIVLVVLMAALGLRRFPPEHPATRRPGWWRQVVEAPALLAANRVVRAAMGALAAAIAFAAMGSVNNAATMLGTLLGAPAVAAVGAGGALVLAGAGTAAATAAAAPALLVRGREQPKDGVVGGVSLRSGRC
ncbi:hypothetical protein NFA_24290 [Nocardia farcinica IFM 10152]|uniref:Uncharacterized protein n=2 Tax=Nocardia farcinica TaxID=37329 RepID=Q5YX15_NOCFA|nr:hypothetical protein NFA_24290 [Nocardia farcinica IFM 10152]